jgi:hypothetical protein
MQSVRVSTRQASEIAINCVTPRLSARNMQEVELETGPQRNVPQKHSQVLLLQAMHAGAGSKHMPSTLT